MDEIIRKVYGQDVVDWLREYGERGFKNGDLREIRERLIEVVEAGFESR